MEVKVSKLTAEKEARVGGEVNTISKKVDLLSQDLVREVSALKRIISRMRRKMQKR